MMISSYSKFMNVSKSHDFHKGAHANMLLYSPVKIIQIVNILLANLFVAFCYASDCTS